MRYLYGPVSAHFADQHLQRQRKIRECVCFGSGTDIDLAVYFHDAWPDILRRLPAGWSPDAVVLSLAYTTIPQALWTAPIPIVGLATDPDLLWHNYRQRLRSCDLVLTDSVAAETFRRAGIGHVRAANLSGCPRSFVGEPLLDAVRDIDILFVGNLNPAVQGERLPWLARLARLSALRKVVIRTGVFGDDYRGLLSRARIVFNRSRRGECNRRAFEAAAAGALMFQESSNRETQAYLQDRAECVYYDYDNLEELLDHYLDHEEERGELAEAARAKALGFTFENAWQAVADEIQQELPALAERAKLRVLPAGYDNLHLRTLQALSSTHHDDQRLTQDLHAALESDSSRAGLHNALGLVLNRVAATKSQDANVLGDIAQCFRKAIAHQPGHVVAGLNLVEALVLAKQYPAAVDQARRTLAILQRNKALDPTVLESSLFPPGYGYARVQWERAAWQHAGQLEDEARAKRTILLWRLHTLLGELTGDKTHFYEALLARPDLPIARAALGKALVHTGKTIEAIGHLQSALKENPFDRGCARDLYAALGVVGDLDAQRALSQDRRLLEQAAPEVITAEPWMSPAQVSAPAIPLLQTTEVAAISIATRQRVSLSMIVKNEEKNLPACLRCISDLVDEVIVVDTGSSDRTREVARAAGALVFDFPWVDHFAAARNESLRRVTGQWVLWLDADDRLDETNRQHLRNLFAQLGDDNAAYVMKVRSLVDREGQGGARLLDQVRLFRNHPYVRWQYRVHEQILPAVGQWGGETRWTDIVIHHTGYQDDALRRKKLERNLRLLLLEQAEQPNDPFTLFNLGRTYLDLGNTTDALGLFRKSLERSSPNLSTVRKLYSLIAQGHHQLGQRSEALAACREGLAKHPDDAELLFHQGVLFREENKNIEAEASFLHLLKTRPGAYFDMVDAGLRTYKARHQLACIYHQQKRYAEAEAQLRVALAECPDFVPLWLGLGDLFLWQSRWEELEQVALGLEQRALAPAEAMVVRARGHRARKDFPAARRLLVSVCATSPRSLGPRLLLSHVLLEEGKDWSAAEQALRDILALHPDHPDAMHNLGVLQRRKSGRGSC